MPTKTYSVTVNSFLSTGGDNFGAFAEGTNKQDTGQTDLEAMVDFMAEFAKTAPLPVDSRQHAVGLRFPGSAPATYSPGDRVGFALSSLAMTGAGDAKDAKVTVKLGGKVLGSFPVTNTVAEGATDDEAGTASIAVKLPADTPSGTAVLTVIGDVTGTAVRVPVKVAKASSTVKARIGPSKIVVDKTKPRLKVVVKAGGRAASGKVKVIANGQTYSTKLKAGKATITLARQGRTGKAHAKVIYLGNATTEADTVRVTYVVKPR